MTILRIRARFVDYTVTVTPWGGKNVLRTCEAFKSGGTVEKRNSRCRKIVKETLKSYKVLLFPFQCFTLLF